MYYLCAVCLLTAHLISGSDLRIYRKTPSLQHFLSTSLLYKAQLGFLYTRLTTSKLRLVPGLSSPEHNLWYKTVKQSNLNFCLTLCWAEIKLFLRLKADGKMIIGVVVFFRR